MFRLLAGRLAWAVPVVLGIVYVGFSAALAATLLGSLIGAVCGFVGGKLDMAVMRIAELFQAMPSFVLAALIVALLSKERCFRTIWVQAISRKSKGAWEITSGPFDVTMIWSSSFTASRAPGLAASASTESTMFSSSTASSLPKGA
jgi:ABC-type dipeptide/oligopeptide/nickel transport system permease subunit